MGAVIVALLVVGESKTLLQGKEQSAVTEAGRCILNGNAMHDQTANVSDGRIAGDKLDGKQSNPLFNCGRV